MVTRRRSQESIVRLNELLKEVLIIDQSTFHRQVSVLWLRGRTSATESGSIRPPLLSTYLTMIFICSREIVVLPFGNEGADSSASSPRYHLSDVSQ